MDFHSDGAVIHTQCGGGYTTLHMSKYMEQCLKKKAILLYDKIKSKNSKNPLNCCSFSEDVEIYCGLICIPLMFNNVEHYIIIWICCMFLFGKCQFTFVAQYFLLNCLSVIKL